MMHVPVKKKADVNLVDKNGYTAAMFGSLSGNLALGLTPLILAAKLKYA